MEEEKIINVVISAPTLIADSVLLPEKKEEETQSGQ